MVSSHGFFWDNMAIVGREKEHLHAEGYEGEHEEGPGHDEAPDDKG